MNFLEWLTSKRNSSSILIRLIAFLIRFTIEWTLFASISLTVTLMTALIQWIVIGSFYPMFWYWVLWGTFTFTLFINGWGITSTTNLNEDKATQEEISSSKEVEHAQITPEDSELSVLHDYVAEIEEFVEQLRDEYNKETKLMEICNVTRLSKHTEIDVSNIEFYQIGRREKFPLDIIKRNFGITVVPQMARSITKGEQRIVLEQLNELADNDRIGSEQIDDLTPDLINEAIESAANVVGCPDHIFLPMADQYWDVYHSWIDNGYVEFRDVGEDGFFINNNHEMEIHMVHPSMNIKDIYILNSDSITIFQKEFEVAEDPVMNDWAEYFSYLNESERLMIYFGEGILIDENDENYQEKIDLIYRVVVSDPSVESRDSAYQLVSPDSLTFGSNGEAD